MKQRLLAVGDPPFFRHQVAQAIDAAMDQVDWVDDLEDARLRVSEARGDIDTVVISSSVDEEDALELAIDVNVNFPATAIVLVRETAMNGSLPVAMRAGIRDVVDLSQGDDELEKALERATSWAQSLRSNPSTPSAPPATSTGLVVSVFSSKGGTGKTFLSSNLATAIAERSGEETALLDLDLSLGDVFSYFGKEPVRPIQDLLALGEAGERSTIMACGTELGEHLVGFGSVADPGAPAVDSSSIGPVISSLRGCFPYVVVDVGTQYTDHALAALDASDLVCLVTGLDVVGVKHLSKAIETLVEIGISKDRLRIVLNRADSKVGIQASDVERVLGVEIHTRIPSSRLVPASLNKGTPAYSSDPRSDVAKSIGKLADNLIAEHGTHSPKSEAASHPRRLFRRS